MPKQIRVEISEATEELLNDLNFAGLGGRSAIISEAIALMHRREMKLRKPPADESDIVALYGKILKLLDENGNSNAAEDMEALQLTLAALIYGAEHWGGADSAALLERSLERTRANVEMMRGWKVPPEMEKKE